MPGGHGLLGCVGVIFAGRARARTRRIDDDDLFMMAVITLRRGYDDQFGDRDVHHTDHDSCDNDASGDCVDGHGHGDRNALKA